MIQLRKQPGQQSFPRQWSRVIGNGNGHAITRAHQHILAWAGLRGALALALSLGLPKDMPHAAEIVTVAFALVGFSVVFQGLTITPLMKSLGEFDAKAAEPNSRAR